MNVGLGRPLPPCPAANATHQVLDGGPHFLISVGVDDRVHDRVEDGEEQQPAFEFQDVALFALESVQKQNHKSRSPTDHKRSKYGHHSFDELDRRPLSIYRSRSVRLQDNSLSHHIDVNPQVYAHHDEEEHQVGHRPEDQVAPAKDGCQFRAQVWSADTVPAQTRNGPHEY